MSMKPSVDFRRVNGYLSLANISYLYHLTRCLSHYLISIIFLWIGINVLPPTFSQIGIIVPAPIIIMGLSYTILIKWDLYFTHYHLSH